MSWNSGVKSQTGLVMEKSVVMKESSGDEIIVYTPNAIYFMCVLRCVGRNFFPGLVLEMGGA